MGELASVGAAMIWACCMLAIRYVGAKVTGFEINYLKTLFAFLLLVITVLVLQIPFPSDSRAIFWLFVSGVIGLALGDTALFSAVKEMGAQLTATSQLLAPIFALIGGYLILGEKLGGQQILGFSIITAAVGGIIWRRRNGNSAEGSLRVGFFWGTLAALGQGLGLVFIRIAAQDEHFIMATLIRMIGATLGVLVMARLPPWVFIGNINKQIAPSGIAKLCVVFFFGTFVGVSLMTYGAQLIPAAVVGTLTSTTPLWAVPLATITGLEKPDYAAIPFIILGIAGVGILLG